MIQFLIDKQEGLEVYPFFNLEEITKKIFFVKTRPANVGDILLYNKNTNKMKLVKADDNLDGYDVSIYSPVGVVIIPSNHDLYGTGEFTVISLDNMDYNNPDTGSTTDILICWGGYNYDIPELYNYTETGYLPSTYFGSGALSNDELAKYKNSSDNFPSPYNADRTFNLNYFNTNCLSDTNGKFNTDKIMSHVTGSWQSGTITNSYSSGNYPAACCCRRYSVLGTNPGDWYLGAAGEMGYMIARFKEIQNSIIKIIGKFSKGAMINTSSLLWCSTECSKFNAYIVGTSNGIMSSYNGKNYNGLVRALLRVSRSQLDIQ